MQYSAEPIHPDWQAAAVQAITDEVLPEATHHTVALVVLPTVWRRALPDQPGRLARSVARGRARRGTPGTTPGNGDPFMRDLRAAGDDQT
jgi:hypothetical protein